MNRCLALLLFVPVIVLSQTTLPAPTGYATYSPTGTITNIGDFDGDGSDDVFYYCQPHLATGLVFTVYSYKKAQYLLVIEMTYNMGIQAFGDFNGDTKNEIIVENKVYEFPNITGKKKAL